MALYLSDQDFELVVRSGPLFSIDFVLLSHGKILLGRRNNRPAQGSWFVPGGRVRKSESIADAVQRLSKDELGAAFGVGDSEPLGVFEHFYDDSIFGEHVSTHYIAYGLKITKGVDIGALPDAQHSAFRWWGLLEALESEDVHYFTKLYLKKII